MAGKGFLNAILFLALAAASRRAPAQAYGKPDTGSPGDAMIQGYLAREAEAIHARFLQGIATAGDWERERQRLRNEYLHMLGLRPLPEKTPLRATVTGTLAGDGFRVDKLHFQSRPRLYVTANLYRPAADPGERLPAVLYVCGHSSRGRNGNKTAFQSHGIWFARHGYVCLIVDTLQLGEIAALHHGTYREQRWWWHSRGYTPAGVECWNGIRAIDYLTSREDVDPERIAVTGISGGGAATFWIAAADERVRVAVPVSGMADLPSYVGNQVINGHCDCMFLYNTFRWPWTRIAALVAPRPLLFVNSDADPIFPMDANERIINRLERVYSLFGAGDRVDSLVSIGGHDYRKDIRRAAYRFINTWLEGDPTPVLDSEEDLVVRTAGGSRHPIEPEELRVFPEESDIPEDELNTTIDEHFVPAAAVPPPAPGGFEAWKLALLGELRRVTFGSFPARIEAAEPVGAAAGGGGEGSEEGGPVEAPTALMTEEGITVYLRRVAGSGGEAAPRRVILTMSSGADHQSLDGFLLPGDAAWALEPRGDGRSRWTTSNPPNYVERSHVLLGRTADTGRVRDIAAVARYLRRAAGEVPVYVHGAKAGALLAAYAALWEPEIAGAFLEDPPATHMDPSAPQFLNVLRVCDVPEILGMLAPRSLVVYGGDAALLARVVEIYTAAGASDRLERR